MRFTYTILAYLTIFVLQGCTNRTWYDSFRQVQRDECYKGPDSELEDCLRATEVSFDEYKRQRRAALKE